MNLSNIEAKVISTLHSLPVDKQQEVLDFSLFLVNRLQKAQRNYRESDTDNTQPLTVNTEIVSTVSAGTALKNFLKKYESEPIDIDTRIFDAYRATETDRNFTL